MAEQENTPPEYLQIIPEQYREVPSIKDAGSLENLLEQHVNLERKMGDSLFFPGKDADADQQKAFRTKILERAPGLTVIPDPDDAEGLAQFYNKLGRPADAKEYAAAEVKGPDDKPIDMSGYVDDFKAQAHAIGLTAGQFQQITKWFGERTANNLREGAEAKDALMGELKKQWGDTVDARIKRVQGSITKFGGDNAAVAFGELGANPVVLETLDRMAEALSEEGSLDKDTALQSAETRAQIEDDIATLKKNAAYLDRKNPDHDRTVERVNALYEKLTAFKAA